MKPQTLPFVSVVVPTRNRPEKILKCFEALLRQQYPAGCYEIIIVDDGSDTPVEQILQRRAPHPDLRIVRRNGGGPAAARNAGLAVASGSLAVFTDDDCVPADTWIGCLARAHQQNPEAGLGGTVTNAVPQLCSEASQALISYLYEYFDTLRSGKGFYTSNNVAFPTDVLRSMGGFDTSFPLAAGEDRELCHRWTQHGRSMLYVPEATVEHWHALDLYRYSRQHFSYGRGAWHFHQIRAQQNSDRVRIEPIRFYASMLAYPFAQRPFARAVPLAFLLGWSQAANASGFFYEALFGSKLLASKPRTTSATERHK